MIHEWFSHTCCIDKTWKSFYVNTESKSKQEFQVSFFIQIYNQSCSFLSFYFCPHIPSFSSLFLPSHLFPHLPLFLSLQVLKMGWRESRVLVTMSWCLIFSATTAVPVKAPLCWTRAQVCTQTQMLRTRLLALFILDNSQGRDSSTKGNKCNLPFIMHFDSS